MAVVDINNGNVRNNFETMKYEFEKVPGVIKVAASSRVPGEWKDITQIFISSDQQPQDSVKSYFMSFDEDMTDVYHMEILQGENFSGNRLPDSTKVIINEKMVNVLNLKDPVGKYITVRQTGEYQVIGVLKDFHFQSLHEDIAPLVIGPWSNTIQSIDYFSLKLSGEDLTRTLTDIRSVHEQFDNTTAIELNFLNQQLQKFYQADERAQTLFAIGAFLTIFIACLGLFGLASFTIQRRVKEISIRKVLGATISNLLFHLSKSFANQIIVAFTIAAPFAWWAMYQWLSYFSYRINLGAGAFIWALGFSLGLGLLTIGHRVLRAAMVNPAKTLKND
jgi:putative ABC transport system permease protein